MTPVHPLLAIAEREAVLCREANPHMEIHVSCDICTPDGRMAFCGAKLRGITFPDSEPTTCPVCDEMEGGPCPRCGA